MCPSFQKWKGPFLPCTSGGIFFDLCLTCFDNNLEISAYVVVAREIQVANFSEPKQLTLEILPQINWSVCKRVVTAESWSTVKVNRSVMTFSERNTNAAHFLPEVSDISSTRKTDSPKKVLVTRKKDLCLIPLKRYGCDIWCAFYEKNCSKRNESWRERFSWVSCPSLPPNHGETLLVFVYLNGH